MVSVAAQISWEGSGKGRVRLRPSHCSSWKSWLCCGWQKQGGDCAYVCLGSPESLRQMGFTRVLWEILMGILDVAEDANILFWILCVYIWRSEAVSSVSCPHEGRAWGSLLVCRWISPLTCWWGCLCSLREDPGPPMLLLLAVPPGPAQAGALTQRPLHRLLLAVPGFCLWSGYMWLTGSKWQCCLGEKDTSEEEGFIPDVLLSVCMQWRF